MNKWTVTFRLSFPTTNAYGLRTYRIVTKRVLIDAPHWSQAAAHARARLPWSWCESLVEGIEVR